MSKNIIPARRQVASLDVHPQKTFTPACPLELPIPDGHQIVDELNAQAKFAQFRLGVKEAHPTNPIWLASAEKPQLSPIAGENVDVHWRLHAVPGTLGFELIKGLPNVTAYDYFVWEGVEPDMHPYGACYHDHAEKLSTGIIEFLRANQVTTVIVGGLATDYCVKITALQLLKSHFNVFINLGACRGIDPVTTQKALVTLQEAGAILVNSAAELEHDENSMM